MSTYIDVGQTGGGETVSMDLEELLATRLLVQGNSGSGKSHLLRRILEGSAGLVQQVVIDPEGDFVSLADAFGHVAVEASDYSIAETARIAARIREHRASVVLSLEGLEVEAQMRCVAAFLSALFDAPREQWYPALVVVDEAQIFAPAVAGEVSDEARRASLGAMTNLMCRGRKRGLAGIIATQRLAKLAKNVAAEASNFLMGRTFLDIDMMRAADLLGMERRQAEVIRDLARGEFLALGPAVSRRAIKVSIGAVTTAGRSASPKLVPLPVCEPQQMDALLFAPIDEAPPPPPLPVRVPVPVEKLVEQASEAATTSSGLPPIPQLGEEAKTEIVDSALVEIVAEADSSLRPIAGLYQDFLLRCRMRGLSAGALDLSRFKQRLAMARAGVSNDNEWSDALALGASLPEEMLGLFLAVASAARESRECPSDATLAQIYGTSSLGRVRRMLAYLEEQEVLVSRIDLAGKRTISVPRLGWITAPAFPEPDRPSRLSRPARRTRP